VEPTKNPKASGGPSPALVAALRRILSPLVRLLIAYRIPFPYLAGLLKGLYVEVADREFPVAGKAQTDSRIRLLTGVHRKDVKRLRGERPEAVPEPPELSLSAQLIARWIGLADTLDEAGRARPLPRLAKNADGPSFEGLVASVSQDIRPRAVLDDWLAQGIAHLDEADRVVLNVEAFIPEKDLDEKSFYLGRNVHDHLAAAVANLLGPAPPYLERSVYYARLSPESARELDALARAEAMRALKAVNRRALDLKTQDAGRADATRRIAFGAYFFSEEEDSEDGGEAPDDEAAADGD